MPVEIEPYIQCEGSQYGLYLVAVEEAIKRKESQTRPRQPTCRNCNEVAVRQLASLLNPANPGRPYYICPSCPREDRWVCWEDTKGVSAWNPPCDCEKPSRLDIIGKRKKLKAGMGFWSCARGKCWYYSENRDGTPGTSTGGGFYPRLYGSEIALDCSSSDTTQ